MNLNSINRWLACTLIGIVSWTVSTMCYPWWYTSDDRIRMGKHWCSCCTGCCIGICSICYYPCSWRSGNKGVDTAIAVAIPLAVAGLFLTMICRTLTIPIVHFMDGAAEQGNMRAIDMWQILAILLQGIRIAIPAAALCVVPAAVCN